MQTQKLPLKVLIRHSLRLLFYFILASGVVNSLYEHDLKVVIFRLGMGAILFLITFFINIGLLSFFEKRKKSSDKRIGRKVFFMGWLFTGIVAIAFYFWVEYLKSKGGWWHFDRADNLQERFIGYGKYFYLFYVSLLINSFVFLIQNFILHQIEKNRIENELLQLKAVNAETTNQLLQQQIQPHFLFNALNILKLLIKKYPNTAEAYLLRLSNFLRTSVTGNKSGIATVEEELKLCEDYMEMQKIRFGKALNYEVSLNNQEENLTRQLPFFSLQPLLENAIKHNELTEKNPLIIVIILLEDEIIVKNNLSPKNSMEFSTGNGLSNLQERYRLLSGDVVIVEQDESQFVVHLKLL